VRRIYKKRDRQNAAQTMTATYVTVRSVTWRVEGIGHKLYRDNFLSSLGTYDDLYTRGVNCCGTV